jgi:MFS family permease
LTRDSISYHKVYHFLLIVMAAALPLSVFTTSVVQFLLLLNWIVEGNFSVKWERLKRSRALQVFLLFFLLHAAGIAWSTDMQYGLHDLKIKLPLLVLPFLVVTSDTLSIKELRIILAAFIGGCIVGSLASILALLGVFHVEISDYRDASLFISHIRFALMIVLAIFFSGYLLFVQQEGESRYLRLLYLAGLSWLPVFLIILRSLSGIVIIVFLLLLLTLFLVQAVQDRAGRFMLTVMIIFIPLFAVIYTGNTIKRFYAFEQVDYDDLDSLTVEGNPYIHHPDNRETENGNFVWLYFCPQELEREWNRLSDHDYMGKTENGNFIRFTLIRYLTSKGLRKDAVGVNRLDSVDVAAIERGIANHIYLNKFALYPRIYEVIWEFDRYAMGYSPNDKSLIQRYYYLKAGLGIASENLLYGVGTGDVRQAFNRYYEENDSPLRMERRRRAHNQYLTFLIAFGIPGLLICLFTLVGPVFIRKRWGSYMALVFLLTMALSMLNEDTLENTSGVVLFAFFYALFIFGPDWPWKGSRKKPGIRGASPG